MKLRNMLPALLAGVLMVNVAEAQDNVHFSGALVAEPCTLPVADTDIHVEFGTVNVKYLYQYQRTKGQPFTIHLEDCDPSVMKTVSVTFEGTADDELNTMLALDSSSSANGVVIGLELPDGSPLAINKAGSYQELTQGINVRMFNAYVQAKPLAISGHKIIAGNFTAISTFVLAYQ